MRSIGNLPADSIVFDCAHIGEGDEYVFVNSFRHLKDAQDFIYRTQRYKDADALYAFKSRGFSKKVGVIRDNQSFRAEVTVHQSIMIVAGHVPGMGV